MRNSLKEKLNNLIQQRGQISHYEIKKMCEEGTLDRIYRISNAERRLRKSESPNVEAIEEGGAIVKYVWRGEPIKYQTYRVLSPTGEVEREIKLAVK